MKVKELIDELIERTFLRSKGADLRKMHETGVDYIRNIELNIETRPATKEEVDAAMVNVGVLFGTARSEFL